jgi:acyl-CoA synthetase (AMP-forming)/AMP-acid ligase II
MTSWSSMLAPALASEHVAVIDPLGDEWTGRELGRRMAGAADWLDAAGIAAGTVAAVLTATPAALALAFAAATTGRPLALLSPRHTAPELAACIARLPGEVIVTDEDSFELMTEVSTAAGRRLLVIDDPPASDRPLDLDRAGGEIAFVLHTSGTTGQPKPVPIRQARLAARARNNAALLGLGHGSRYATSTGFHHISGLGGHAVAIAAGAATVVTRRYTTAEWKEWERLGVTHALLVPTMIGDLLARGELATPTLRCLQYGAAPIRPGALAATLDALPGVDLVQFYGQTEGTPIAVLTAEDHRRAAAGSPELLTTVGRPAPAVELVIRDPDADGIGHVLARAEHMFLPDPDGWLATGDLGCVDAEGYLHLEGRLGDKIIRGGENIYPAEVERVLGKHPQVADVAVYGLPDARLGEVVKAYIVAQHPDAPPDVDDLRQWARAQLAGFKVPAAWSFLPALPRNPAGKVLRRLLEPGPDEIS